MRLQTKGYKTEYLVVEKDWGAGERMNKALQIEEHKFITYT